MADRLLQANGITKVYGSLAPTVALNDVTVSLDHGEFVSLVGQSGSGKSTLLNMLGLLDTPTSGEVRLDDLKTNDLGKRARAGLRNRRLGFVFQFHYLLPEFSVLENVLMPTLISGDNKADALSYGHEVLELLGLSGLENKSATELSGGQKQRVAIGRALMNKPALVLADEPTGNLDTTNTDQVFQLFRQINKDLGTAFLIVTHDRRIAQQTDRILEIQDGKLIQDVLSPV